MKKIHPRLDYFNVCQFCGKRFHPFKREAKYCDKWCRGKSRREGKMIKCSYCKKEVYKKRKWFGKVKLFYCSKKCKDLDSRFERATKEIRNQLRWVVQKAIKEGRLKKLSCEVCGNKKSCAHHYLGYERKHWLDVQWLCRSHHSSFHQEHIRKKHII